MKAAVPKDSRIEKRARSLASMGLVKRIGDKFRIASPSLKGRQNFYHVWRDKKNRVCCSCLDYQEGFMDDEAYRCEHIMAVKFSLQMKNTEQFEIKTESHEEASVSVPACGEQNTAQGSADVLGNRQPETTEAGNCRLMDTNGDTEMKQEYALETATAESNNVMNFPHKLRSLRQHVDPDLVKTREGWRDRNGNVHMVDYIEWHTVADILDETAPNWTHTIRDIKQIGNLFMVIVAITIDGVTREGIGTGPADSEVGIKKAEHDALKRAAVKFGIARDLYKKEYKNTDHDHDLEAPANPIAASLSDLVTAKQLGMIRALAREKGIDANAECSTLLKCSTDELSKKAASYLISHLQEMENQKSAPAQMPLRKAS